MGLTVQKETADFMEGAMKKTLREEEDTQNARE
jgi:hypothetical protein